MTLLLLVMMIAMCPGIFGRRAASQPIVALSAFSAGNQMLAGTPSGQLLLFEGRNCVAATQAHDVIITVRDLFFFFLPLIVP
jgi:hypothetical protein